LNKEAMAHFGPQFQNKLIIPITVVNYLPVGEFVSKNCRLVKKA